MWMLANSGYPAGTRNSEVWTEDKDVVKRFPMFSSALLDCTRSKDTSRARGSLEVYTVKSRRKVLILELI